MDRERLTRDLGAVHAFHDAIADAIIATESGNDDAAFGSVLAAEWAGHRAYPRGSQGAAAVAFFLAEAREITGMTGTAS